MEKEEFPDETRACQHLEKREMRRNQQRELEGGQWGERELR